MARKCARRASAALLLYVFSTGCMPPQPQDRSPPANQNGNSGESGSGGRSGASGGAAGSNSGTGGGNGSGTSTGGNHGGGEHSGGSGGGSAQPTGSGGKGGGSGSGGSGGTQAGGTDAAPPSSDMAPPSSSAPKLSTDILPIVKEKCARSGCHDPVKKEHGMNLSTAELIHSTWVDQKTNDHCMKNASVVRVTPGKPESSFVVTLIKNDATRCSEQRRMPPAPLPALTATEVKMITDWVAAGALKD
jgi:hypothetical protein